MSTNTQLHVAIPGPPFKLLIGGALVDGASTMEVINPATAKSFATAPRASAAQLNQAVAAAKHAFPGWSATQVSFRRSLLLQFADALMAQAESLAQLLTQEQGKPLAESQGELAFADAIIRQMATQEMPVRVIEDSETRRIELYRRPLGVVVAITPWNFPVLIASSKYAPALLAGNTVVLKPPATTPLTTLRIAELMAGIFPPGVMNVIADANDLGSRLTSHPDVAKISFTGSTATGRKVMSSAAATIKRLTLELGGNDAAIVLGDADPVKIAPALFNYSFFNAGQVCLAIKRVYAHSSLYDRLCAEMARIADSAVVGDGLAPGTQIGPLQNEMQFQKVQAIIADARRCGTVITSEFPAGQAGYFIRPTIVRDIADGTRLVDEEQFGPVLPIIRYDHPDEALARANSSDLGLGGSVWSSDRNAAYQLAVRMNAGTVFINKHLDFGPTVPFGGAKQSGIGVEFAAEGFHEFTQLHVLNEAK